jgi:hypothetical protein
MTVGGDFMRHLALPLAILLISLTAVPGSSQGERGVTRIALPDTTQQEREADKTVFRSSVTRDEVSALVLDRDGAPVRGLIAADFEVLEDGVRQVLKSFMPFSPNCWSCRTRWVHATSRRNLWLRCHQRTIAHQHRGCLASSWMICTSMRGGRRSRGPQRAGSSSSSRQRIFYS